VNEREGRREGGRERGRDGEREEGREGGREEEREGGQVLYTKVTILRFPTSD